ncbi:GlcG/HbpS family heme-binding protein [Paenibacillus radicis (ex Xue et al. 2023)]|uniref:Heme-binding protein n=1 Tax=Paenibacillus radicis (ex Xue et al. 2023) TaxID=2972489 RepID=A0ABT1YTA1_9BACL|nr:heme-binding protein [Paenibacillus radicis (ex Xue et al. 2023)]MCR8635930.1 heme-binding protein [Paenibacillus radicis (ex Xue et al. 2023)]
MHKITSDVAKALLVAAERKSRELGLSENIAIVDDGGNLVAFLRMDNARIAGIDIAQNKAWTSVAMKMPTANLAQAALPGGPSFGINITNNGKIVILGGGIPLVREGMIVGGIGVSGGTSAQDVDVANAAIGVFESIGASHSGVNR